MADIAIVPPFAMKAIVTSPTSEKPLARWFLMAAAFIFLGVFLLLPLIIVFDQAFSRGPARVWETLADPDTLSAIWLTLLVAVIAVPLNLVFGVAAAWSIAKFEFKGKAFLTLSLIHI